jgi:hypothetical protein
MFARLEVYLTVALLIAAVGSAGAEPLQPSVAPTPNDPAAASGAPNSSAPAYNQAATTDPYNQSDFSSGQSFGLVASQMLGAAAACEQLHSDNVSLSGLQAAKNAKAAEVNRSALDAAQQNMLDPAATSPGNLKAGAVDCDRLSGSYSKLQEIQLHNANLTHELDQPDATYPSNQPGK